MTVYFSVNVILSFLYKILKFNLELRFNILLYPG